MDALETSLNVLKIAVDNVDELGSTPLERSEVMSKTLNKIYKEIEPVVHGKPVNGHPGGQVTLSILKMAASSESFKELSFNNKIVSLIECFTTTYETLLTLNVDNSEHTQ